MAVSFNTGVPLAGGTVNSPGSEQQSEWTFFDALSSSALSHSFTVHESPVLISGYGIPEDLNVYVIKVTKTKTGEIQEGLSINGRSVALNSLNNVILIDLPGMYRLQVFNSGEIGTFTVVGQQTAMGYWSWGLAAYGNAVDQGSNSQNPTPPA